MEPFDDTSLHLSFFNSIFELLAGYNLAYAGLDIISNFINAYVIRNIKRLRIVDEYFIDKRGYYNFLASGSKDSQEIDAYLNRLSNIIQVYKNKNKSRNILNVKTKVKFVPLFLYCGFYCFYILLLAAISESQKVVVFNGDIFSLGLEGIYSIRGYAFLILFIFNIFSTFFLLKLAFRDWTLPNKDNKIEIISARPLFLKATVFFGISIIISIVFRFFLGLSLNDSIFFELVTVIWSILTCLAPILSLSFWGFVGYRVKASVYSDISKEIESVLRVALTSTFLRKDVLERRPVLSIEKYENKDEIRKLLYFRFFKLYRLQFLSSSLFLTIILYLLYNFVLSNDKEILNYVESSIKLEYNTYKQIPKVDTSWFDKYYTKNSSVKKNISDRILHHLNNNEVITNITNPSKLEVLNSRIINITDDRIIIETNEIWLTKWYNTKEKKYTYQFNEQSKEAQTYILIKENGKWLIDKSETIGESEYLK